MGRRRVHEPRTTRRLGLLACLAALLAAAPAAAASEPVVRIEAAADAFAASDAVRVHVTIANPGATPLAVTRWETPEGAPSAPLFDVRDAAGAPVAYLGIVAKRPDPTAGDEVAIPPGGSLAWDVDLAASYAFPTTGDYTVRYAAAARLVSNTLALHVAGRSAPAPRSLPPAGARGKAVTFTGCTAGQQAELATALADADAYAAGAEQFFSDRRAGARYRKWFGSYDATRWATVRDHYAAIHGATTSADVHFDCTCVDGFYAYVYPSAPYTVYLCAMFWSAPATGTDSKAGTLIHELSHFTVLGGTDDHAYGQTSAAALAVSSPALAVMNADSHEYFAENTPVTADASPALTASASGHAFGTQAATTTSGAFTVVLTNTGDATLHLGALSATGDFLVGATACSNTALAARASCSFDVRFAPASTGAKTGGVSIPSDAAIALPTLALSGTGTDAPAPSAPVATPGVAEHDFGVLPPGETGAGFDVAVTNTGTADLVVGVATVSGPFAIVADTCSGATVAPTAGCAVTVAFAPTAGGAATGSLAIPSNAAGSPTTVALMGTGAGGSGDVTPPTITLHEPTTDPAREKTITASVDEGTLEQAATTGATCDDTLAFGAYADRTFAAEADNGTRVCYRATDAAGNTAFARSAPIAGIDRTSPSAVHLDVQPPAATRSTTATFRFSASDASGAPTFTCRLDGGRAVACTSPYARTGLAAAHHVLVVQATDAAGNAGPATTVRWAVQAERLVNGGLDRFGGRTPTGWRGSGLARGDGRSTLHVEGAASLHLVGAPGRRKAVAQDVALAGEAGDALILAFRVRTAGPGPASGCAATVELYDGATRVATRTLPCVRAAAFAARRVTLVAPAGYTRAVVTLASVRPRGAVWLDAVSLVQ